MAQLSVVLSVFANMPGHRYLNKLEEENQVIQKIFSPFRHLRHVQLTDTSRERFVDNFQNYKQELFIFHYGGHADGKQLFFKDGTGQALGLIEILKSSPKVKLVFLNGCDTQDQAMPYIEIGVPAIIATTCPIGDGLAKQFAERFYKSLAEYNSLGDAFNNAKEEAMLNGIPPGSKDIVVVRGPIKSDLVLKNSPWVLYIKESKVLKWKLPPPPNRKEVIKWLGRWAVYMIGTSLSLVGIALKIGTDYDRTTSDLFISAIPIIYLLAPLVVSFFGELDVKLSKILSGIHFLLYGFVLLIWASKGEKITWFFLSILLVSSFALWKFVIPLTSKNQINDTFN